MIGDEIIKNAKEQHKPKTDYYENNDKKAILKTWSDHNTIINQ